MSKLFLYLFLLTTTLSFAQNRPNREKIKSLKVAFITERLDLGSKEAQAFWPVYNTHEEKMDAFRKTERMEIRSKLKNLDSITEREAKDLVEKFNQLQENKHKEQKSFINTMQGIISAKKTILLMKTEEDFKRRLIKQYRKNKGGN
ncbi:hypothetical protein [Costertonia aggregata]|uniref:Sensor of ECF-type sigma factor n=1 Tax=Costertonia aggregata TaxID=343403 RepID=A0A7H9AKY9_9FLAO|nr:hypothetical protein [Costertonia aggregata]QLG43945.1 hypothetical protein HYG79_00805 [Costertonia aggregata]